MSKPLECIGLKKYFPISQSLFFAPRDFIKAVDDVSFSISKGETFCLVGESGSGKTTVARLLLRLLDPTSGKIFFSGADITNSSSNSLRYLRQKMQIVFQSSVSSLNPRMLCGDIVAEPLQNFGTSKDSAYNEVTKIFSAVGLSSEHMQRFPHELSGGQRQRVNIARALILKPEFVVLDEPTSELDVTVRLQILDLLKNLQQKFGLTYLFISHDFGTVSYLADTIAVMHQGKIIEQGKKQQILKKPQQPYTISLLEAVPKLRL